MFRKLINIFIYILIIFLFALYVPQYIHAQNNISAPDEERFEAIIIDVQKETIIDFDNKEKTNLLYTLTGMSGSYKGKTFKTGGENITIAGEQVFRTGDKVIVSATKSPDGKELFFIQDYIRRSSLMYLVIIFLVIVLIIAGRTGLGSLLGLLFSFIVIFYFILPQIMSGNDPVMITILSSVIIIPVTYYLSHGFNSKTHIAIISTLIVLVISGLLANYFINDARITGLASEEAGYLLTLKSNLINIKGLLLAGIIIGMIGIIDDIAISQAAIVFQLKQTSSKLTFLDLYTKAMEIGKDHIGSVVNTLILVYTGAALPLMLLFIDNPSPFLQVINHEIIAEEIIRTLIASIGLIFAVPATTFMSAFYIDMKEKSKKSKINPNE